MASLYEIMREQQDEKLARQLYAQNTTYEQEDLFNSDLSDEELARRLQEQYGGYIEQHMPEKQEEKKPAQEEETDEDLARRLQEEFDRLDNGQQSTSDDTAAEVDPAEFELQDDETAALQYEEDERLAYEMQNIERSEVMNVHPRQFNAVEERYASLKPMHFDENGDEPDDEYYQELEDQEIGYVYRRIPEKLNAQSDDPKALHYQTYSTRNNGKKETKAKKKITKAGKELIKQFRVKEEGFEYGVVLGNSHDQAYCYDGVVRKVHFYKKVRETTFITRGALVLLKLRTYQDEIADVVHIYEKDEVNRLYDMGEITQLDPVLHLPPEVLHTVLDYVQGKADTELSLLNKAWNAIVSKLYPRDEKAYDLDVQINRITWANLRDFHRRFVRHNVTGGVSFSDFFCSKVGKVQASESHFKKCRLTDDVLRVAEEVWRQMEASRGVTHADDSDDSEDSAHGRADDDIGEEEEESTVIGIGLPSDKPRATPPRTEPLFTANKVLRLKYDDEEHINYASTVLWTWWTIHRRKDLDQRPETIDVPIRAALFRMLRRGASTTLESYQHELRGLDKKDPDYLTTKRKMAQFKRYWNLALNPPTPEEYLNYSDEDSYDSADEE